MDDDESFDTNNDTEESVSIKISVERSGDSDGSSDENGRYLDRTNNEDVNAPQLIPATQQTFSTSSVKTAAVTAVAPPVIWDDYMIYSSTGDNDRRQQIGRIGLENLRAVAAVPQKAASFLEQFTTAAYSSDEQVRCDILEYLPHMALLLSEDSNNHHLKSLITLHLLPIVAIALSDHSIQVVKMAESALLTMLEHCLVGAEYIETRIWPVIKTRVQHTPSIENTNAVLTLISKMAPWLGCDQTERLLVPALEQLSSHPEFVVRKMCASLYGDFCAIITTNKTETVLVPSFLRLCADPEQSVRMTCAETFMSVSCTVTLHTRRTQLAPVFARLLSDSIRWVQLAAFHSLGPFITTFAEPSITILGYNLHGELVLKHPAGFEFSLNSYKMDERLLYTCKDLEVILEGGNESNQEQSSQQLQYSLLSQSQDEQDDWDKNVQIRSPNQPISQNCFHQDRQQDDRNNNHDRISNKSFTTEENSDGEENSAFSKEEIAENSSNESEDVEIYNQFQYWRDPLPDIDGDLNCNNILGSIKTISFSTSVETQNTNASDWSSANQNNSSNNLNNNHNNNNINNNSNQRLPVMQQSSPQQKRHHLTPQHTPPQPQRAMPSLVRRFQDMIVFKESPTSSCTTTPLQISNSFDSIFEVNEEEKSTSPPTTLQPSSSASPAPLLQEIVPLELIKHFVSMSEPGHLSENLAGHCAYHLPAVALTLGPKHWDLIKPAYETLAGDRHWKVRRIVASSIHELAVIVGEEVATQDLVPVFNGFIKDLDEVRIAALKHLAHFLKLLRPDGRNSFLPRLAEFLITDYEWNWRFRQELAQQLLQILGLFSPADTCHHLSRVVMALLVDRVSDVRKVALQLATELVSHVSIDVTLLRSLLAELAQKFAHSHSRWNRRQTFALFCSRLVSEDVLSGEMFARDVLPHLLDLSWDRVPNVRLTVARALANDVIVQPYFSDYSSPHYEVLHSVLKRLQGDKDRDVRYFASQVPVTQNPYSSQSEAQYNMVTVNDECLTASCSTTSANLINRSRTSR